MSKPVVIIDFIYDEGIDGTVSLAFADLDRDGDLDLFIGEKYGSILFYQNDGGTFVRVDGTGNPFNGLMFDAYPVPEFVDIDNDGDLDLFVGSKYGDVGTVYFVENTQGPPVDLPSAITETGSIKIYSHGTTLVVDAGMQNLERIEVYSLSGQVMRAVDLNQQGRYELNLPEAKPGLYIVRAYSDGQPTTNKVVLK